MKTTSFASKSFDDLVFENRNKDYGAYVIRRSYDENVNRAFFLTMLAGLFLATCAFIISSMEGKIQIVETPTTCPMTLPSPTPQIILEPQQPVVSTIRQVNANLVPLVTTDVVDDVVVPNEITAPAGSIDGTDDGPVDFTNTGTGTGIATTNAVVKPPTIFIAVEKMPEYVGGVREMNIFLQRKLRYPSAAARIGTEGTVYVSFVIDANGKVILPEILKGLSRECDAEAIRVISKMPAWLAGKQNDVPVMVRMVLPIKFQLNSNS